MTAMGRSLLWIRHDANGGECAGRRLPPPSVETRIRRTESAAGRLHGLPGGRRGISSRGDRRPEDPPTIPPAGRVFPPRSIAEFTGWFGDRGRGMLALTIHIAR